jgi:hypothetical protein
MPCEILIRNVDNTNASLTEEEQRRGLYLRGYPVLVRDYPHVGWGNSEGLPNYVHLRITDASAAQVQQYMDEYIKSLIFTVVNNDPVIDGWRIRLEVENLDVSEYAGITQNTVSNYLNRWNATVQSFTNVSVTFDVLIWDAIKSRGFWEVNANHIAGLTLVEDSYDQATGEHIGTVDYTDFRTNVNRSAIRQKLKEKIDEVGATFISENLGQDTITFSITAEQTKQRFLFVLKREHDIAVWRRKFYFPTGVMNTIEAYMQDNNGEPYETDRTTAISFLNDKQNE